MSIKITQKPDVCFNTMYVRIQPWSNNRFIVSSSVYSDREDVNSRVLSSIEKILEETTILCVESVSNYERVIEIHISVVGDDFQYSIYHFSPCEVDRLLKDRLEETLEEISRTYGRTGVLSYGGFDNIPFDISWFNTATDSFKKGVINNAG